MSSMFPNAVVQCRPRNLFVESDGHPIDMDFVCTLCGGVLTQPLRTPCNHEFGKGCVEKLFQDAKTESVRCPEKTCRDPSGSEIVFEDFSDAPKTARLVSKITALCEYKTLGCDWQGPWANLRQHHLQQCLYVIVKCPYTCCNVSCQRRTLPEHMKDCKYREVRCQYCFKAVRYCDAALHEDRCGLRAVGCPRGCGETLPQAGVERHIRDLCGNLLVECPFVQYGCASKKLMRKDVAGHIESHVAAHIQLLMARIDDQQRKHEEYVDRTSKQLQTLQRVVSDACVVQTCDENDNQQDELVVQQKSSNNTGGGVPVVEFIRTLQEKIASYQVIVDRFLAGSTIVVDGESNCGLFQTIGEALEVCCPGDTLLIRQGVYREAITLDKHNVWIRGCDVSRVIIEPANGIALTMKASAHGARVSNVTLRQTNRALPCVHATSSSFLIEDCNITSTNLSCVVVAVPSGKEAEDAPAAPKALYDSFTKAAGGAGAALGRAGEESCSPTLAQPSKPLAASRPSNSHSSTLAPGTGAGPARIICNCSISGSQQHGVLWKLPAATAWPIPADAHRSKEHHQQEMPKDVIVGCDIFDNRQGNIQISEDCGELCIAGCKLHSSSHGNGIWARQGASRVIVDRCDFFANAYSNIDLNSGVTGFRITGCEIHRSEKSGVCVGESCEASLCDCKLHSNKLPNLALFPHARCKIERCAVYSGLHQGIAIKRFAELVLVGKQNVVHRNCLEDVAQERGATLTREEAPMPANEESTQ